MIIIDLKRIRQSLPDRAKVTLGKTNKGTPYIEVIIYPGLYVRGTKEEEEDLAQVMEWQTQIIGDENIMEIYTEETGRHWYIYLKRKPMNFINLEDSDVNTFSNFDLIENGKLLK